MDVATESKHLGLIVCSGAIGVCDPFLIPFMEGTGVLAKRVHKLGRRHLSFDRDEMIFKISTEVIPTAKIGVGKSQRSLLSVSGPFTGRSAEFEVGQSASNASAFGSEDILVKEVIGFEGGPK